MRRRRPGLALDAEPSSRPAVYRDYVRRCAWWRRGMPGVALVWPMGPAWMDVVCPEAPQRRLVLRADADGRLTAAIEEW